MNTTISTPQPSTVAHLSPTTRPATGPMAPSAPLTRVTLLGGAGKTGGRIAERLRTRGVAVRLASRGADLRFDWDDPTTWPGALEGAEAAYLAFQPDLAMPGADAVVGQVAELARELGVGRLVLLSGRGEEGAERSEQAVLTSHPCASVARCAWFAQNFSEGLFADATASGVIALPAPREVPEPFVDLDDVADVAVALLTEPGHAGCIHELTGPTSISFDEAAAVLTAASGRPVSFESVTPEAFVSAVVGAGLDRETALFLAELFAELTDGRNVHPTTGVAEVLRRPATSFEAYAAKAFGRRASVGAR